MKPLQGKILFFIIQKNFLAKHKHISGKKQRSGYDLTNTNPILSCMEKEERVLNRKR